MNDTFNNRFNISTTQAQMRVAFVNRAHNLVFDEFLYRIGRSGYDIDDINRHVVSRLGRRWRYVSLSQQIGNDFFDTLRALEAVYEALSSSMYQPARNSFESRIDEIFRQSEGDIGIKWSHGIFTPSGAPLLDERLANDQLSWLRSKGHSTVLVPFEKALGHLLESEKKPQLASDVITDAYEALEAMAKIVTEKNRDLSANREQFISRINASDAYKRILKEYIEYAQNFRHAAELGQPKLQITPREAESFLYLTGLFLRLAIQ